MSVEWSKIFNWEKLILTIDIPVPYSLIEKKRDIYSVDKDNYTLFHRPVAFRNFADASDVR